MFLTIRNIPKVSWSSKEPLNFKPKISTFFFLCFGLTLFGIGEGLLLVSFTGASPWSVLAQGISNYVDLSIGTITFLISLFVISLWIFLINKSRMYPPTNATLVSLFNFSDPVVRIFNLSLFSLYFLEGETFLCGLYLL